ncbi:MAG: antibiotic biosynthesis monooxygenase [Acidimicrobiaceae bacterium]|nr:antibiotic biosynthesis monooxygenase [Acidimicrobiaceae bacterium]
MTTNDVPEEDVVSSGFIPADIRESTGPVAVYGVVRAKPGRVDELLNEIRTVIELTRDDAGYEQCVVHTTASDPNAFIFYERWSSGRALIAHVSQPCMAKYFAALAELAEDLDPQWLKPIKFV